MSERLRAGELVAVPTETVYGLAAHALDAEACARVFAAKGRPSYDPLIVHVLDLEAAREIAEFNTQALALAARFWPGPLTLILPKSPAVPDIVTSGRPTVAVRVPAHPVMRALLARCGLPLAAPSANPFGYVSPTTAAHVQAGLGDRIDHILDGGPCTIGVESTIVDARDPADPIVLRPGGLAREAIEGVLGRPVRTHTTAPRPADTPPTDPAGELAPGLLERHYSPRTPVALRDVPFPSEVLRQPPDGAARVFFARPAGADADRVSRRDDIHWLTEAGDLAEAAHNLFALMRALDAAGHARLEFEPAPTHGLGPAINDRLRRAAARG
ncbi:L-threonylcarbamoyladenylate synthase [Congregicoccus parvus]|uniref:L-threonylcarbamoyladenylate synthase n=1 Tax=Congregicoccus parvus TaxID=3081749 RepID=UPI003FA5DE00